MKKTLALLLALVLALGLMAGCTGGETTQTQQGGSAVDAGTTYTAGEISLPLVDEPVHMSFWWGQPQNFADITDYSETLFFTTLKERTNVVLDFISPTQGSEAEGFNLLLTSGDLPDMFSSFASYNRGYDMAIEDDYIMPLDDLAPQYMPNMMKMRQDLGYVRDTTTDNGHIAGIVYLKVDEKEGKGQGAWLGTMVRQDWLDDLGLAVPETFDEMEHVLKSFKTSYPESGNGGPLYAVQSHNFSAGFGVPYSTGIESGFFQVDGQVKYAPIEPGFKEYLMKMHDWFEAGLVNKEFASLMIPWGDVPVVAKDGCGVFEGIYTWIPTYTAAALDEDFALSPVPILVKNKGDQTHIRMSTPGASFGPVLTPICKDPALACRMWDYLYTDEGILLANYGVEGVTFEYENGEPRWNSTFTENEYNYDLSICQYRYLLFNCGGVVYWDRELMVLDDSATRCIEVWNENDDAWVLPGNITRTAEEGNTYANVMGDIQTFISEYANQYIMGLVSFDNYDTDFVGQINSMGIDRAISVTQAALDRYYAR